jgi:hypothetical protein
VFPESAHSGVSQAILPLISSRSPTLLGTDSTTTSAADRRSAHRRVGAATILAFLALLLLGATRGPAQAETTTPAPVPATTTVPEQTQPAPADPQPTLPGDRDPGFDRGGDGGGPGFGGGRGGDGDGGGGGGVAPSAPAPSAPAPSTGGTQT